jgi:hypothetical protein
MNRVMLYPSQILLIRGYVCLTRLGYRGSRDLHDIQ